MFSNKKYKKIISLFLIITFLVPVLFLSQPKETEASYVVTDPGNTAVNTMSKIQATLSAGFDKISSAVDWAMKNKEFVLDGIAWNIAKMAVQQMVTSTVEWINNGFEGNPMFITNYRSFMTDVADEAIGEYLYNNPDLNFLCSPFSLDVKLALYNTFYKDTRAPKCTLSEAITNAGGALKSLENDFRWGTWIEMTNKPSNNPIGAYLIAKEEILEKIALKTDETDKKLQWGEGFMSWEKCTEYTDTFPGGETVTEEVCEIQTPGSVIEAGLNKQLGAEQDSLITADEFNEILNALLMQLVNNVFSETGLLGSNGNSRGGGGSSSRGSVALEGIKQETEKALTESLSSERKYNNIKNDSLDLVLDAKKLVNDLITCLQNTGETSKLNKAYAIRDNNITIPQTNIRINLKKLETNLRDDIVKSDGIILELNTLTNEVSKSKNSEQLSDIAEKHGILIEKEKVAGPMEISDALIERDGYGTIVDGLENGLTYDTGLLINTRADLIRQWRDGIEIYPPEDDKGLKQRVQECELCKTNINYCTVEGEAVNQAGGGANYNNQP